MSINKVSNKPKRSAFKRPTIHTQTVVCHRNKSQKMNLSTQSLYPIINFIWSMVAEEAANYNKEVN